MQASTSGDRTPSCISRHGRSSPEATNWSRSTKPGKYGRCIRRHQTVSSQAPERRCPSPVESRIEFQRDAGGKVGSLTWSRDGAPARTARRVNIERHEDVRFSNGDIQLAGRLISPTSRGPHPAVILVHASGADDREYLLPYARFLIRHGMAVLGYDKRGVGGSTGDWNKASFDDLAGDVVAAFEYPEDSQRYPAWPDWHVGMEPGRVGDAAGRDAREGSGVPHQHLGGRRLWRRDHDRPGAKRDDGQRHAAADDRADCRADDAAVPTTSERARDGTRTSRPAKRSRPGREVIRPRRSPRDRIILTCSSSGR